MVEKSGKAQPGSPYAVFCHENCGKVLLSEQEYHKQMDRPNSRWSCPNCGGSAGWDDEHYENYLDWMEKNGREKK